MTTATHPRTLDLASLAQPARPCEARTGWWHQGAGYVTGYTPCPHPAEYAATMRGRCGATYQLAICVHHARSWDTHPAGCRNHPTDRVRTCRARLATLVPLT